MKRFSFCFCHLVVVLLQTSKIGYCQSPNPSKTNSASSNEESLELFHGRAVCERFNENLTTPEVVLCDDGYKECFTTALISNQGEVHVIAKGCWYLPKSEEGGCSKRACLFGIRKDIEEGMERTCCCRGFSCNKNSTYVRQMLVFNHQSTKLPIVVSHRPAEQYEMPRLSEISRKETVIFGLISSAFATVLILGIVVVSWRCAVRKNRLLLSSMDQYDDKTAEEVVEYSSLSADAISFGDLIYKGKFGGLWLAESRGRKVVIKVYKPEYFSQWKNEKMTYDILGIHPNIAEFVDGVELYGCKSGKAIVLGYYTCGSLRAYLSSNVLTWQIMYNLIFSLASGVAYIHGEIDEYHNLRREFIVHRNLTSSNVLVKEDGTCVLSDFKTSVRVTGKQTLPMAQGANIRYMAPEVLCCKVNWNSWESSLKQADVYSLGLILWEIVRKCADFYYGNDPVPDAALPYQKELGSNPSITQMLQHTMKQRKRPSFPQRMGLLEKSDFLLRNTIEECWDTEPEARLTALCVVKRMQEIQDIKNKVVLSVSDSNDLFEASPRITDPSLQQEDFAEQINLRHIPIANYNYEAAIPCTCIDDISLKESLIDSI